MKAMSDQELYESLKALDPKIGPVTGGFASRTLTHELSEKIIEPFMNILVIESHFYRISCITFCL